MSAGLLAIISPNNSDAPQSLTSDCRDSLLTFIESVDLSSEAAMRASNINARWLVKEFAAVYWRRWANDRIAERPGVDSSRRGASSSRGRRSGGTVCV